MALRNQNECAAKYRPIASPIKMTHGITSHHLLPCCAASRPTTTDKPTDTKLIGYRQFANGGTKTLPSRAALAIPSFPDRVMPLPLAFVAPMIPPILPLQLWSSATPPSLSHKKPAQNDTPSRYLSQSAPFPRTQLCYSEPLQRSTPWQEKV